METGEERLGEADSKSRSKEDHLAQFESHASVRVPKKADHSPAEISTQGRGRGRSTSESGIG